jgi:hypothetical protein
MVEPSALPETQGAEHMSRLVVAVEDLQPGDTLTEKVDVVRIEPSHIHWVTVIDQRGEVWPLPDGLRVEVERPRKVWKRTSYTSKDPSTFTPPRFTPAGFHDGEWVLADPDEIPEELK